LLRNYDHAQAIGLGERAQAEVERFALEVRPGQQARVRLSFAVAEYATDGQTIDELLHAASVATRQRKGAGKLVEVMPRLTETRMVS
jgi:GGDEF domain-containing protein